MYMVYIYIVYSGYIWTSDMVFIFRDRTLESQFPHESNAYFLNPSILLRLLFLLPYGRWYRGDKTCPDGYYRNGTEKIGNNCPQCPKHASKCNLAQASRKVLQGLKKCQCLVTYVSHIFNIIYLK